MNGVPYPAIYSKSGYLGALTYISGLVVLTADRSLALGPFEEATHQLFFCHYIALSSIRMDIL